MSPPTSAPAVATPMTMERAVVDLYRYKILPREGIAKAIVKLKLNHKRLADELGVDVNDLFYEFVKPAEQAKSEPGWAIWTFDDAVKALYDTRPIADIAQEINRTPKATRQFKYRCFKQGVRINTAIWELLKDGNHPDELKDLGHPDWMVDFAVLIRRLNRYAITEDLPTIEVHLT